MVTAILVCVNACPAQHAVDPGLKKTSALRINDIQTIGSHNSYHIQAPREVMGIISSLNSEWKDALSYSHLPLGEQLGTQNLRHFELDLYADPQGGLYADPLVRKLAARMDIELPNHDPTGKLKQPGIKVLHHQDFDYWSNHLTFIDALREVRKWSQANPQHVPILLLLELKEQQHSPIITKPLPWDSKQLENLEAEIVSVFGREQIITPDSVRGESKSLRNAILTRGWPELEASRGKVMFAMDNGGEIRDRYLKLRPDLSEAILFAQVSEKDPAAAFFKLNNPVREFKRIQRLVKAGFIVRTRADADTTEARANDTRRRDKGLASGAHFISTDFPAPDKNISEYAVQLRGKQSFQANSVRKSQALANPVSAATSGGQAATAQKNVVSGSFDSVDWNSLIGQQLSITGDLVIVDTYDLARRGQVKVARDRLYVPTSKVDPNDSDANANSFEGGSNVANVVKAQKLNDKATIIIDDGSARQNIFPPKLFPGLGKDLPSVRVGSTIHGVSGKLIKAGNALLLIPDNTLHWTPAARPQRPAVGDAGVTVASFNVLNYFTTIDNGKNKARGADTESELQRQEAKLVSAILALQADVVGLMEIENNLEAEMQLVAALNQQAGKKVFAGCGLPNGFASAPGGHDAIRVGMIYRADRVDPVGGVSMIVDDAFFKARTPIVHEFKSKTGGKPFTVIVNHFKSKGGAGRADVTNKNKGDGQGAYNPTRRAQSLAVCNYIDQMKQANSDFRALVIGDLNAYEQEDPIDAMRAKGLIDLHERFKESNESSKADYSYVYRGQSGSLDHAMATDSMAADVTGLATWHINADEPKSMDYNQEYNPKPLYQADPFRSSDHDPVLIGIRN